MPYKIMIVDDEPANLRLLERLFRRDYQVLTAASGQEALQLLEQHDVALLVTDQRMPGMTGIELLKRTAEFRPHMVRIILTGYTDIGALVEAINCGQVYKYVTKPWNNDQLRLTVARAVEHYEDTRVRHELELTNKRLSQRLQQMTRAVVRSISDALEAKDEHLYGHARRVSGYAAAAGRRLRLDTAALEQLALASTLHDIGMIGTPDSVLLKPGPLTDEERACVQTHPERGARMLASVPEMEDVAAAVRHHHERWDGTGYPAGLAGERIPLASRIIRVADAYDAMTNPRPFRDAFGHEAAVARLREEAGRQFDPEVVRAFCELEALARIRGASADAARLLAERTGLMTPGGAYALGLLHDAGELLLCSLFPEEMENLLWLGEEARLEREVAAFGVDHAQVSQWALEALGLPRALGALVQTHHDALRINAPAALLLHRSEE